MNVIKGYHRHYEYTNAIFHISRILDISLHMAISPITQSLP